MNGGHCYWIKNIFGWFLVFILVSSTLIISVTSMQNEYSSDLEPYCREVIGPINIIKNSHFSEVSDWELTNGTDSGTDVLLVDYDNRSSPSYMNFINGGVINNAPFRSKAYLNQTFNKYIWTPDAAAAVVCSFDFTMNSYYGEVGTGPSTSPVYGEIYVQIMNTTSGGTGVWSPIAGVTAFLTNDPRITIPQSIRLDIGGKAGNYNICPSGEYQISLYFQISCGVTNNPVTFDMDMQLDNLTITIEDKYEPIIIPNALTFGPFKNSSAAKIDVDFFNGDLQNTSLKTARYRLNNSGITEDWQTIFTNKGSFTGDWSIGAIWEYMIEGNNTIDIYCEDALGNFNNSVQIFVIKDTGSPQSKVLKLERIITKEQVEIKFDASDSISGIDYVELWYKFEDDWYKYNSSVSTEGKFNSSPILFNVIQEGLYEFLTVAYDRAGNIEASGTPADDLLIEPDSESYIDYTKPSVKFLEPTGKYLTGEVPLIVQASNDMDVVEFHYWVDVDSDGNADKDDSGSKWIKIGQISANDWNINKTLVWNTTDYGKFPGLKNNEPKVILRALAKDLAENEGGSLVAGLEIDNTAPEVTITKSDMSVFTTEYNSIIKYTTDNDVVSVNLYYSIGKHGDMSWENWSAIQMNISHNKGEPDGSYKWIITKALFQKQLPELKIKVEVIDDAGLTGSDIAVILVERPEILVGFPDQIIVDEDFETFILKLTDYESHANSSYTNDDLRWYVTGNSEQIFKIIGGNRTGVDADTFVYTSISDQYGEEILTFHLHDPVGLEITILQTVVVQALDTPPEFLPPKDPIHVTVGEEDIFDLSPYITDVDTNISDITLTTDDTMHITVDGLSLKFNYGMEFLSKTKTIHVMVSDSSTSIRGNLYLQFTDNHRPKLKKTLPFDLEINSGESKDNVLNLNDYFMDPDEDKLTFTLECKYVYVTINTDGSVSLEAPENKAGIDKVFVRATDPDNAFVESIMIVTIIDTPDPPKIKPIPNINVHYYNPNQVKDYPGYSYDFSYFISDPDNDRSELTIWAIAIETELVDYIEIDPNYNMNLIFKFPFETADSKIHPLYLYVKDPTGMQVKRLFNVTVIIDNWPVMQIRKIEDQSFDEDSKKDDAFKVQDYFWDMDGGTSYEIITKPNSKISAVIDQEGYVDLASKVNNWYGTEELVLLAHDSQPEQFVYACFNVIVLPCNCDFDLISHPMKFRFSTDELKIVNISDYFADCDTPIESLQITSSDPVHVVVNDGQLLIKYDEPGTYNTTIWITDIDQAKYKFDLEVEVIPKKDDGGDGNNSLLLIAGIGIMVVVIILIIILLYFVILKKRIKND